MKALTKESRKKREKPAAEAEGIRKVSNKQIKRNSFNTKILKSLG